MLFVNAFEFIFKNIFLNIILILAVIFLLIWAYNKSVESRRYYKCPQCGESFRTEHAQAECCKVCGAKLQETSDTDVSDSAK